MLKKHGRLNVSNKRRRKNEAALLTAGGSAGRVVDGDFDIISAPSGPRPRPSYNPQEFLDENLGKAFYALLVEQRDLIFGVWKQLTACSADETSVPDAPRAARIARRRVGDTLKGLASL